MRSYNRVTDCIAPAFFPVHNAIKRRDFTHYWLCGGRGSTKSSFAAIQTVLAVKHGTNAVVIRKVGETLRDSVFAQILWAIDLLGCTHEFTATTSPFEMKHASGCRILFRGLDKPEKLKSLTFTHGHCGLVWVEETDQVNGMEEIRNVLQTLLRGGDHATVLYTYNPPRHRGAWVNKEETRERSDRLVHRSCYTDVPPEWLGPVFLSEADRLKELDDKAYRHEYLGEPVGLDGVVFDNLVLEELTDEQVAEFDRIHNGVDWGYDPDPFAYVRMHYDAKRRELFIFDEFTATKLTNSESAEHVFARTGRVELVMCDSAEPKSIRDFRDAGIDARPAKKGKESVAYGMKFLRGQARIVIDPRRCPVAAREFGEYEHVRDRGGDYTAAYPDGNDHVISAVRYAMVPVMNRRPTFRE